MAVVLHIAIMAGIYVILATSLNLILGYAGLFSVGHGAFYGIGAYSAALIALKWGMPFGAEVILGAAVSGFFGLLIGLPTLRLRGDYLALATFGFAVIVYTVLNNWYAVTRGPLGLMGIPPVRIFSFTFDTLWSYAVLVGIFAVITVVCVRRLADSSFGRVLTAIREDDIATLSIGKNIARFKVLAFVIGAIFAGVAGTLYAHYMTFIDPSSFVIQESFLIFSMVVFGGMGTIRGSVAGATILVILPEALRFLGIPSFYAAHIRQMIFGALIVFVIVRRPQGLWGVKEF